LGTSFLGAFVAFVLSLRNLGLEFRSLVLYYSFARVASYPMAPTLLNLLLVSSKESL
jgi:hypothetical protein